MKNLKITKLNDTTFRLTTSPTTNQEIDDYTLLKYLERGDAQVNNCDVTLIFKSAELADNVFKKSTNEEDAQSWFMSPLAGKSVLLRDEQKGIIRIGYKKHDKCYRNVIRISDNTAKLFFADVSKSNFHRLNPNIWGINLNDTPVYKKWSTFMDNQFEIGIKNKSK